MRLFDLRPGVAQGYRPVEYRFAGSRVPGVGAEIPQPQKLIPVTRICDRQARLANVDLSSTTTTTLDPNVAWVTVTCPPAETEAVGSYRAEFEVETYSPVDIRQWGIDYGDGRSYTAGSEATAEEELWWHNYYETGSFEVKVWTIDVNGERTEGTCTVTWSN